MAQKDNPLLEPSPYTDDGGHFVGRLPRNLSHSELKMAGAAGVVSPIKAIRRKCLDCVGYNEAEVRKCVATSCPLWPFRMGRNPFHGSKEADDPIS